MLQCNIYFTTMQQGRVPTPDPRILYSLHRHQLLNTTFGL